MRNILMFNPLHHSGIRMWMVTPDKKRMGCNFMINPLIDTSISYEESKSEDPNDIHGDKNAYLAIIMETMNKDAYVEIFLDAEFLSQALLDMPYEFKYKVLSKTVRGYETERKESSSSLLIRIFHSIWKAKN